MCRKLVTASMVLLGLYYGTCCSNIAGAAYGADSTATSAPPVPVTAATTATSAAPVVDTAVAVLTPLKIAEEAIAILNADKRENETTVQREERLRKFTEWLSLTYVDKLLTLYISIRDVHVEGGTVLIDFEYNDITYSGAVTDIPASQAAKIEVNTPALLQASIQRMELYDLQQRGERNDITIPLAGTNLILVPKVQDKWHVYIKGQGVILSQATSLPKTRRIAYVIDHSGSMTDSIMYVRFALKQAIRQLKNNDQFYVVFYSSGPALEMPSHKMIPGTQANKQETYGFIDSVVPIGQTDPTEALTRAFAQHPEMMYILTDGEFDPQIASLVERLNSKKEVAVNTICFVHSSGEPLLRKIAQKNNGLYRFVGEGDITNKDLESLTFLSAPDVKSPDVKSEDNVPSVSALPPLPDAEKSKIERMTSYLEKHVVCASCKGHPVSYRVEKGGSSLFGRSPDVKVKTTCSDCDGTGYTPRRSVRETISAINQILDKYDIPAVLRDQAEKAIGWYDRNSSRSGG